MTKRSKSSKPKSQKKNQNVMMGGLLALIVLLGAGFLLMSNQGGAATVDGVGGTISPQQYQSTYIENNTEHLLVDVRTPEEFSSGHIAGAVNIPLQEISNRLSEIPQDEDVVIYCRSGNRSAQAFNILADNGYTSIYDLGGIVAWQQAGYALQ